MTSFIFLIFAYFTEALIVFLYTKNIYRPKKNSLQSFILTILFYTVIFIIYKFLINNEILNLILIAFINMSIIYLLFSSSIKSALFHGIVLTILQLISEFLTAYFTSIIYNITSQDSITNHFELGVIISRILYFLLGSLLSKISAKETKSNTWGRWCALSLLPISSMIIIAVLKSITDNLLLTPSQNIIVIVSTSILLLTNIVIYVIYEKSEKSNQRLIELEIVNQKNDIDMRYLNLIEKKNETMNIMAHDYKNHILTISNMTDSPEIKDYINNMIGEIANYNQIGKTQNRLLDVILSKYEDICKENEITFKTDIMSENLKFIINYDLSAMLNNILDNAVEAAVKSTDKFIYIEIASSLNSYHKITVINSCDTEPKSKNNKLVTTKSDKNIHGFGTKSIRKIVNKYNGEMQWEYDNINRNFKLVILFPENKN